MAPNIKQPSADSLFFSPSQTATNFVQWARESTSKTDTLDFGVPSLDKYILPLRKGWIRAIVARPGHGKSTLSVYLARREAQRLAQIPDNHKVVVYWTLDQQIEEIEAIMQSSAQLNVSDIAWGRADLNAIDKKVVGRESLPLWYIGSSEVTERRQPRMTYENVYEAIHRMEQDYGVKASMLVIDYIQNVPGNNSRLNHWEQIGEAARGGKELTRILNLKTIFCVQANRATEKETDKVPSLSSADGSAEVERVAHQQLGLWRPVLTEKPTEPCPRIALHFNERGVCNVCGGIGQIAMMEAMVRGKRTKLPVTQNLFIVQNNKQRFSSPGQRFILYADMGLVALSDLEIEEDYDG